MASHKLPEIEPKSEFLSLPVSLASHHLLPVEFSEMGLLSSMVAHQIYQSCPENIEEAIPLTTSLDCESMSATSAQELNEDSIEDNLRENLKAWFEGVDFKATYGDFEEDQPETTFGEDSVENISMEYEVPTGVDQIEHEDEADQENVEEVETKPNESNSAHKLPKMEEEAVEKETETSMAAHKLPEIEPKSEFLTLPVSLASHHLLPVEFPEMGILSSMVAHQIFQFCPENIEEAIPLTTSLDCESMSATSAQELNEDRIEDNLRENLKTWFEGVDFKATYGDFEEDQPETTFGKDSVKNISMEYEVPMIVEQIEDEDKTVQENVGEVETESVDSNVAHKPPKMEEEEVAKEA